MNAFQQKLYDDMMKLSALGADAFYFKDHKDGLGDTYRVFNYRLASYTEFLLPSALECRGILFQIDSTTKEPIRLACMMPEKFFNLNENPLTMNLTFNEETVDQVMLKEDGSIISTYVNSEGHLRLKSKTSLNSMHANEAMKWLMQNDQSDLYDTLHLITKTFNSSVHMEFVSPMPDLKVVVAYPKPTLIIHSIRSNNTGEYESAEYYGQYTWLLDQYWVEQVDVFGPMQEFVDGIKHHEEIEGYIIKMKSGQKIKIKTDWYNARHHAKFGITSLRHLFEYFIDEKLDDVKAMLFDDVQMMNVIANLEATVRPLYAAMIRGVEEFYQANKDLDRKTYAIKARDEAGHWHGLLMSIYLGKEPDYPKYAKNNPLLFCIDPKETIGSLYVEEE